MMRVYLLSFASVLLISCDYPNKNSVTPCPIITIDNSSIDSSADISAIIDSINILLIKEQKGNYMADILKIKTSNAHDYFFYDLQTNKINVFNKKGDFIKTLSKAGDGPNDPLNIADFWIADNGEIQVYDYAQMKLFRYDSQLIYKGSIKSDQFNHFSALEKIPNSKAYVGYANFNMNNKPYKDRLYQVAFLDENLNVVSADAYFENEFRGVTLVTYPNHFTYYKDTLRFFKSYDNNIYSVSGAGLTKRYRIIYNKNSLPDDVYSIIRMHTNEFKNRSPDIVTKLPRHFNGYTRFNGSWYENDKFIYLSSFIHQKASGSVFLTLLDKNTNHTLFNANKFLATKKYKMQLPPFRYFNARSNELIGIENGNSLKKMLSDDSAFQQIVEDDANLLYLIKVKLKN